MPRRFASSLRVAGPPVLSDRRTATRTGLPSRWTAFSTGSGRLVEAVDGTRLILAITAPCRKLVMINPSLVRRNDMTVRTIADGVIVEGPTGVESDRPVTAFILGTHQTIRVRGQQVQLDDVPTCEVVCVDELAAAALLYSQGDHVLVSGVLQIHSASPLSPNDPESQFVRIEIHADAMGRT